MTYVAAVCVTKEPWTTVKDMNYEQTNANPGLSYSARFEMFAKRNCKHFTTQLFHFHIMFSATNLYRQHRE